jgi:hypothetical protein
MLPDQFTLGPHRSTNLESVILVLMELASSKGLPSSRHCRLPELNSKYSHIQICQGSECGFREVDVLGTGRAACARIYNSNEDAFLGSVTDWEYHSGRS